MKVEHLKSITNYNAGQREAAKRVLIEITNLFCHYENEMIIIGGWTPELLFPDCDHIGSIDVDVLCNKIELTDSGYLTIKRILEKNGYKRHPENFFSFQKEIIVDSERYIVDLDLLTGRNGSKSDRKSQKFQGISALKLKGGDFAFTVPSRKVRLDGLRPDGAKDSATIRVVSLVPFIVLKTDALNRSKAKDAYDIYFCLLHADIEELVKAFRCFAGIDIIQDTMAQLKSKFSSTEHAGPEDIVNFLEIEDIEERKQVKRDAFERISYLVEAVLKI